MSHPLAVHRYWPYLSILVFQNFSNDLALSKLYPH